jgi:hypothetical protein
MAHYGRNGPQGILGLPPATNTLLRNTYAFWWAV